ncbi:MAG: phosphopantetheine-binding protein, partial [Acidobacteriota bacterium]
ALSCHPGIRETVVLACEEEGETRLAAYVVPDGSPLGAETLRAFLRERLPEPMVPSWFVALDALPRTPNGKLDRRAMPLPGGERPDLEAPFVEPGTDLERTIAEVWREVLRLDRVGLYDNFFDLGGNSLTIAQVRVHLYHRLAQDLPLVELFRFPTVGALASYLDRSGPQEAPSFAAVEQRVDKAKVALERQRRAAKARKAG